MRCAGEDDVADNRGRFAETISRPKPDRLNELLPIPVRTISLVDEDRTNQVDRTLAAVRRSNRDVIPRDRHGVSKSITGHASRRGKFLDRLKVVRHDSVGHGGAFCLGGVGRADDGICSIHRHRPAKLPFRVTGSEIRSPQRISSIEEDVRDHFASAHVRFRRSDHRVADRGRRLRTHRDAPAREVTRIITRKEPIFGRKLLEDPASQLIDIDGARLVVLINIDVTTRRSDHQEAVGDRYGMAEPVVVDQFLRLQALQKAVVGPRPFPHRNLARRRGLENVKFFAGFLINFGHPSSGTGRSNDQEITTRRHTLSESIALSKIGWRHFRTLKPTHVGFVIKKILEDVRRTGVQAPSVMTTGPRHHSSAVRRDRNTKGVEWLQACCDQPAVSPSLFWDGAPIRGGSRHRLAHAAGIVGNPIVGGFLRAPRGHAVIDDFWIGVVQHRTAR